MADSCMGESTAESSLYPHAVKNADCAAGCFTWRIACATSHLRGSDGEGLDVGVELGPEAVDGEQRVSIGALFGFLRLNTPFQVCDLCALHLELRGQLAVLKLQRLHFLLGLGLLCLGRHGDTRYQPISPTSAQPAAAAGRRVACGRES